MVLIRQTDRAGKGRVGWGDFPLRSSPLLEPCWTSIFKLLTSLWAAHSLRKEFVLQHMRNLNENLCSLSFLVHIHQNVILEYRGKKGQIKEDILVSCHHEKAKGKHRC